ncbi:MAG: hypothetical protein R2942_14565 [Ignavibacteria bacterium]
MRETLFQIKPKIYSSEKFTQLKTILSESKDNLALKGVNGSLTSFIVDHIYNNSSKKIFIVSHDIDRVVKLKDDIDLIGNSIEPAVYSSKLSDSESTSGILINLSEGNDFVVVSNAAELTNKIISRDKFKTSLFEIKKEENKSFDELIATLDKYNFNRKDFVEETGDYSVRGGIVDLFSENMESPVRIEFFGDTIESVREFDINSQRSVREIESVKIGINLNAETDEDDVKDFEPDELITDYLPEDTYYY